MIRHISAWIITLIMVISLFLAVFPLMTEYEDYWDAHSHKLSDCVNYNSIRIVRQKGDKFTVVSDVERSCGTVLMTWRDSAWFLDENDELIARTIPCNPEYGIQLSEYVCNKDGWHQYQWWKELDIGQGRVVEPWIYTHRKVPEGARKMGIISFQRGVLYDGFFGKIESSQVVKTKELFELKWENNL